MQGIVREFALARGREGRGGEGERGGSARMQREGFSVTAFNVIRVGFYYVADKLGSPFCLREIVIIGNKSPSSFATKSSGPPFILFIKLLGATIYSI